MKNLFMQGLWGRSNCIELPRATAFTNTSRRFPRTGMLEFLPSTDFQTYLTPGPHKDMAGMCLQLPLSLNAPNP
jgi:hypothetical protein